MNIDKLLYTIKCTPDVESHIKLDEEKCRLCEARPCTHLCPAQVYEWDEDKHVVIVNYENCLECGACRIACPKKAINWEYPKGTKGVVFKQG